jgi:CO/xanthine dehydrogenase FAD-binding subunit
VAGDGLGDLNADLHGSAEYRRSMIKVFTVRALKQAAART